MRPNNQHREGDALLIEVGHQLLLPVALDPALGWATRDRGTVILARGEATGHAHILADPGA